MHEEKASAVGAHRLGAFSDAVIAVMMTIMVLELKAVAFYAALFLCVDIAYNVFEREVLAQADTTQVRPGAAHGEAPISRRSRDLCNRDACRFRRAAPRLWSHVHRVAPALAAGGPQCTFGRGWLKSFAARPFSSSSSLGVME